MLAFGGDGMTRVFRFLAIGLSLALSGQASANFGVEQNVSNTPAESAVPTVSLDGVTSQIVVWADSTSDNDSESLDFRLRFVAFPPGSPAPASAVIPGAMSLDEDMVPRSVVATNGEIHVVYQGKLTSRYDIFHVSSGDGGATWTAPFNISNDPGDSFTPAIAIDSQGRLHVAWSDDTGSGTAAQLFYRRREASGVWGGVKAIPHNVGSFPSFPDIVVTSDDRAHLVWIETTSGIKSVYYTRETSPGAFAAPRNVSGEFSSGPLADTGPALAVGPGDRLHLVWSGVGNPEGADIFYQTAIAPDFKFIAGRNISNNSGFSIAPRVGADSANQAHVVWTDNTLSPQSDIMYAKVAVGPSGIGVATGPLVIEQTPGRSSVPDIAVDVFDGLHVCWQDDVAQPVFNFEILCADAPESIPPQTTCTVSPSPDPACGNFVNAPPVTVTLTSTDNSGSVAQLNVRPGSGGPQSIDFGTCPTTGPFQHQLTVTEDGQRSVRYSAVDCEGNVEPEGRCPLIRIDTNPPTASAFLTGSCNENCPIYAEDVTVTMTASDPSPGSGVSQITYRLDGGPDTTYTKPFTVTGDGEHTVEFWATDVACNTGPTDTVRFEIRRPLIVEIVRPADGVVYYNDQEQNTGAAVTIPEQTIRLGESEVVIANSPLVTGANITVIAEVTSPDGSPIDWVTMHVDGVLRGTNGTDKPSGSSYSFRFDDGFPVLRGTAVIKITAQDKPPAPIAPRKGTATKGIVVAK